MIDNFNIHNWRLKQAITELEEKTLCKECGSGYMEEGQCMECGYMEEGATFTDKHDDNPKLKGGQKDLPDEVQAKIVAKEGKNYKFNIGDKLQTYGGEESVTVVGVQPHLAAALKDDKNSLVIDYLKKALRQGLVDREQASQPWYLVKFEDGLPDTDLRYWAEDELESISGDDLSEGEVGEDFNKKVEDFIAKHINIIKDAVKFYKNRPDDYEDSLIQTIYNFFERYASKDWENLTMDWPDEKDEIFYNALKSVLSKKNINEGEDHEVSMAQNSLKAIISAASQLMAKLGDNERNIPGWIQDHIAKSENYIEQANQSFHELDNNNEED